MRAIITYLTFDGNCSEAMKFYKNCLGGELQMMPFSQGPPDLSSKAEDRIMHANLKVGSATLMASDTMPGRPLKPGNNFSISLDCESMDEIQKLFEAFSEGGNVTMPLQDTFWGAHFGMLTDKFGIQWMFNFEKSQGG